MFITRVQKEQVKTDREMYDVVTARAVANLRVLSELCIPTSQSKWIIPSDEGYARQCGSERSRTCD